MVINHVCFHFQVTFTIHHGAINGLSDGSLLFSSLSGLRSLRQWKLHIVTISGIPATITISPSGRIKYFLHANALAISEAYKCSISRKKTLFSFCWRALAMLKWHTVTPCTLFIMHKISKLGLSGRRCNLLFLCYAGSHTLILLYYLLECGKILLFYFVWCMHPYFVSEFIHAYPGLRASYYQNREEKRDNFFSSVVALHTLHRGGSVQ